MTDFVILSSIVLGFVVLFGIGGALALRLTAPKRAPAVRNSGPAATQRADVSSSASIRLDWSEPRSTPISMN